MTEEQLIAEREARKSDEHRDSLADLRPFRFYAVPVTREQILAALRNEFIDCGQQTSTEVTK